MVVNSFKPILRLYLVIYMPGWIYLTASFPAPSPIRGAGASGPSLADFEPEPGAGAGGTRT